MTTKQMQMNTELFRLLQEICANEDLMSKGIKALKRILDKHKADESIMSEEELNAKIERAIKAYEQGECHAMESHEDLTAYLKRRGHDL